ncbi:CoA transferase [Streptomyces sp. NPDC029041]|uniref:CaiB/BaiF CoA transferase family protein n=1 Tax=Streptomyces sp. NPDC029041 TaxID=3155727 RepID=UPI00340E7E99
MIPTSPPPGSSSRGPLTGVKVLDAGNVFAAPFAAALLGDLGADVVKIEVPSIGDPLRGLQPFDGEESLLWASLARNKRSITLDLRQDEGRDLFLRLVAEHDVLLENFRPGTLDRWGLDVETLRQANPDLVVTRVSGYGQSGPYAPMPGFGTPATAFSGYVHSTGFPDGPPVLPPINLVDYVAGLFAAFGTMSALYHRDALGGEGQEVDVALYESILRFLEAFVTQYDRLGTVHERQGNQVPATVPCGLFQASDDVWMVLSTSTDKTFNRLAALMGREDMTTDPRYRTNRDRVLNREAVNGIVTDWFGARTGEELQKACDDAGVPVSRVNTMADVFADPHVRQRESLIEVEHPALGTLTMPAIVPRFSRTPGEVRTAGPALGQHTYEVLSGLGLSDDELDRLAQAGVI